MAQRALPYSQQYARSMNLMLTPLSPPPNSTTNKLTGPETFLLLLLQEVFVRGGTAHEYTWIPDAPAAPEAAGGLFKDAPALQLSGAELRQQVQLVSGDGGLLGRGATALVFKCLWPQRFGPNTVLAAKVLKDGIELDATVLQAFSYESAVLASLQ
jgi:hypothetical protein